MTDDNTVKIAVVEEQIKGLREQQKSHADNTAQKFDMAFEKLDNITEAMNKGKGVFAASLFFAGVVGGLFAKLVTAIVPKVGG